MTVFDLCLTGIAYSVKQEKQKNEGLPATTYSIQLHIQRANYQTMIWKEQRLPSPVGDGWELSEGIVKPVLVIKEAAPKERQSVACAGRTNEIPCTEACGCIWQMKTVRIRTTQTMLMTTVTMRFTYVKYLVSPSKNLSY